MRPLTIAIVAMLVQQAIAYMSTLVMPVAAPEVAAEFGLDPSLIGLYSAMLYVASLVSTLGCGGFILRYGPLRMSQVALVLMSVGLALAAPGELWLLPLSALVIGTGSSLSTPSSSQLLTRYAPPKIAPLVFSIKQTGVPVGGALAGLMVPLLAGLFGWRSAFWVTALICLLLALLLQPMRAEFDRERQTGRKFSLGDVRTTIAAVVRDPALLGLAIAGFTYVGVQAVFAAFFVAYLTKGLGYELTTAGYSFAIAQAASIGARILWGWLAGRYLPARAMLAILGIAMACVSVATGLYTPDWSLVAITAVAVAYSATAISWHGVMFAEIARLVPPNQVGGITGGVLSFVSAGMMLYPGAFGVILATTGSYGYGFFAAAVPALAAGLLLCRPVGATSKDRT